MTTAHETLHGLPDCIARREFALFLPFSLCDNLTISLVLVRCFV